MRLSLFHPNFEGVGGAEVLTALQAQALRGLGWEISLTAFGFDRARWAGRFDGVAVQVVPRRSPLDALAFWSSASKLARRARRIGRALSAQRPDLVLAVNHPCPTLLGHSGLDRPRVWYCCEPPRGLHPLATSPRLVAEAEAGRVQGELAEEVARWKARKEGRTWHRTFERRGVASLDRVIAISAFTRDAIAKVYGIGGVELVYPMVTPPPGVPARHGRRSGGLHVLVQTRMEALKNVETVLRGFDRYRVQADADAALHLVGEGGSLPSLRALAQSLPSAAAIHFHGFLAQAELDALRARCDVFALLPLDEPFGMVFPENALRGLLLVGPDHGGPFEILEGGELGWTVPPFDAEALAGAFAEIGALPDAEVDRRRTRADEACRQRYAPEALGRRMDGILRGMLR